MNSAIKLSICCISYNHANFIAKAIDSFLSQKVDFRYELVISDDKSTDSTAQIIEEYSALHSDKIRVLPRDKNVGMNVNFFSTLSACRGEYIAICEGDDYWTDINKLQRQVEILDSNPNISFVFHDVEIRNDIQHASAYKPYADVPQAIGGFDDVLFNHFIPTLSIVFRKSSTPNEWPSFFYKIRSPDRALALTLLLKGKYYHIPEKMGVYRHHDGGITKVPHAAEVLLQNDKLLYESFYEAFALEKDNNFSRRIALAYYTASRRCFQCKRSAKGLHFFVSAFSLAPVFMSSYVFKKLIGFR